MQQEYCNNCGQYGHKFKDCDSPKTSYGIVCIRNIKDFNFLLIRRRNSLSYIEFLRGRYKIYDYGMLSRLFKHMTKQERDDIKNKSFDELWDDLWINNKYKKTDSRSDYDKGKLKFTKLREGIIINFNNIIMSLKYIMENTYSIYDEPEWDFPKGRRNLYESDEQCAIREFCEETNYNKEDFDIISPDGFEEIHIGTNGIKYRTIYFLAILNNDKEAEIDMNNKFQRMEISKIGWFKYELALSKFRDTDIEKKKVIKNVFKKLIKSNDKLIK